MVSAIGPGLLVLVGVHEADTDADADYMCVPSLPALTISFSHLTESGICYFLRVY